MSSSIASRANADVIESMYASWKQDPSAIDPEWSNFFEGFELGMTLTPEAHRASKKGGSNRGKAAISSGEMVGGLDIATRARIVSLVYNFRTLGHTAAHVDPLQTEAPEVAALSLSELGFEESHLFEEVSTQFYEAGRPMALGELIDRLKQTYCGKVGFEFMHIHNPEVRNWIRERAESRIDQSPDTNGRVRPGFRVVNTC